MPETYKKIIVSAFFILTLTGIITFVERPPAKDSHKGRPDIIILSICSLRSDLLQREDLEKFSPTIKQLLSKSHFFPNGIAPYPWTDIGYVLDQTAQKKMISDRYETIGTGFSIKNYIGRNYLAHEIPNNYFLYIRKPDTNYGIDYAINKIQAGRKKPIFAFIHLKHLHTPYVTQIKETLSRMESPELKKKLTDYFQKGSPEPYHFPMLRVLFSSKHLQEIGYDKILSNQAPEKIDFFQRYLVAQEDLASLKEWRAAPTFSDDIDLIKSAYRAQVISLDREISRLITALRSKESERKTILVVMGDHGEGFMEHDQLFHGSTLHDEMLRFPIIINFPDQSTSQSHQVQVSYSKIESFVHGLIENSWETSSNQISELLNAGKVISKNCAGNLSSVRYNNKLKYIYDRASETHYLYDLEKDPKELVNLIHSREDIPFDLHEMFYTDENKPWNKWILSFCQK